MKKKIKYYKIKPEHVPHVMMLIQNTPPVTFHTDSVLAEELDSAKVLDIWCEPVYEREMIHYEKYINIYPSGRIASHDSQAEANRLAESNRVACIYVKGSFENLLD